MDVASVFLGIVVGTACVWLFFYAKFGELTTEIAELKKECGRLRKEMKEVEECGRGMDQYQERINHKKELGKKQILTALKLKKKIKNEDIVDLIDVSAATAVRYMDELEEAGKIVQVGNTGRGVFYSLNTSGEY